MRPALQNSIQETQNRGLRRDTLQGMEAVAATPKIRAVPDVEVSEERLYATEKIWSVRRSILFMFVICGVLWALIILGTRQIF